MEHLSTMLVRSAFAATCNKSSVEAFINVNEYDVIVGRHHRDYAVITTSFTTIATVITRHQIETTSTMDSAVNDKKMEKISALLGLFG